MCTTGDEALLVRGAFDAIAGLLHSVEDRTTLCGHALHQWYAPVTFAGGRGVGVLEFVVANATEVPGETSTGAAGALLIVIAWPFGGL